MNAYVMTLHFLIGHLLLRQYTISHDDDDDDGGGGGGGDNDNVCKGSVMTCLLMCGFCILQKCR